MSTSSSRFAPRRRKGARRSGQLTLDDARRPQGRGGWRPGAGRPRSRTGVEHGRRERFAARHPQHVTLRAVPGLGSLRRHRTMRVIRSAIRSGGRRDHFRVIEFSVQSNHIHLIVEASGSDGLTRGMIGLEVRIARRVNRVLDRAGRLFADRYHSRSLRTPTEVRAAIRYVLDNHRHHADGNSLRRAGLDPCSSAVWFGGWATRLQARERWHEQLLAEGRPTASPTVWLLTVGWRRLGPLCLTELGADRTLPPSARSHPR